RGENKTHEAMDQLLLAVESAPRSAAVRKELGYAYLRVGETQSAREVFEQALSLEPQDFGVALELAFLSHETGKEARALELFDLVRRSGDSESQNAAEEAFGRVGGGLRGGIGGWSAGVGQDPANRAARPELALNPGKHREPALAVEQYLAAWRLPPRRDEILLDLA